MLNRIIQLVLLTCFCGNLFAQIPLNTWRDHYSFKVGKSLCFGNDKIFCATDNGIFTYKPSTGEIDKLTKTNGLSDVDASAIEYIDADQLLAIGYANGNIDLVYPAQTVNIVDILNKTITGSKSINGILSHNNLLYLSTGFGIVVLDANREEIKDTYYIGANGGKTEVYTLKIFGNRFYAATSEGLMSADINNQFLYNYQNWTKETYSAMGMDYPITDIAVTSDALFFAVQNGSAENYLLWKFDGNSYSQMLSIASTINHINISNNKILVSTTNNLSIYNFQGVLLNEVSQYENYPSIKPYSAMYIDSENLAIADQSVGLVYGSPDLLYARRPNGIVKNTAFALAASPKYVIAAAGAYNYTFSNSWSAFATSTFENNTWTNYTNYNAIDAVALAFNPRNESEYYVASWGKGLFQFNEKTLTTQYTPDNSSLQYNNYQQCRISGMCFDSNNNLWVSNPLAAKPISVRKTDGSWVSFNYATQINTDKVATLHCSDNNLLWLLMPREAIFVLDAGNDIDSQTDDKFKRFKPVGPDGSTYSVEYNTMAFDQNNYLWLGTSQGILVCYTPNNIINKTVAFQRIKLPDVVDGFAVYLLENENITSITVDGGDRKWIGTSKSGAFLFSADGTTEIYHFSTDNSPLPSNNILDIKIHPTTGEVFFGTDKGLVSYRGEATSGANEFGKVYAFPNPVHPDFSGQITITGLVKNTIVKITDISGNLVYETKSLGGSAIWNGKNFNGHRVATGVYLVLLTNSDGSQKAVTKILFIN